MKSFIKKDYSFNYIFKHPSDSNLSKNTKKPIFYYHKSYNIKYNKITYNDTKQYIDTYYKLNFHQKYSSSFDIIASYLKGQKFIYMESCNYTTKRLYFLMIPAIAISSFCSILPSTIQCNATGEYIIAIANGLITFLLTLISFMKLDAASQAYKTSAYHYDKLQSAVEFQSGKLILFYDK